MFFQDKNKPSVILTKSKVMNMDITTRLLGDDSNLIDRAKNHLSVQFNSTLVLLNWEIGSRIDQKGIEHLKQSIIDILTTPNNSRIMRRDYGSRVFELVDKPINRDLTLEIYAATAEALEKWEKDLS